MFTNFHFIRPYWLLLLPIVIAITWFLWKRRLTTGNWKNVVDENLAPYVLASTQLKSLNYRWILLLIGGALAVIAMAGPSWKQIKQPVFRSEAATVIALDLSRSMDAQDLSPSRLARARLKILDILDRRKSGQVALLVYTSNAFTVSPLTTDSDTVAALVNTLSTEIMPSRGSYPPAAIQKGQQLLEQAGVSRGEVILITDGGTSPAAEEAARQIRSSGYILSVLAIGTSDGAPIPRAGGGFVTDRSGNIAIPKLEVRGLKQLSNSGGGNFAVITADDSDLDILLSDQGGSTSDDGRSLMTDDWQEEGPWLLLILLPIAAITFRRGVLMSFVMFASINSETSYAFDWNDIWLNSDQKAERLLKDGNASEAAELFVDPAWRAVALYRAGNYAISASEFGGLEEISNLYNLGNALARSGRFESAIEAYEEVLETRPDDLDAQYNRDLLQDLLDQQKNESNQENDNNNSDNAAGGQQSEGQGQSEESSQQGQNTGTESQRESGESPLREEDMANQEDLDAVQKELQKAADQVGDQPESEGEEPRVNDQLQTLRRLQEKEQAMEQWLRRIPDDPGGLLRRKFRYQYQREGRDQDGNNLWPDDEVQPW